MLGKLLKYDLKWTLNLPILVYYGLGILFSIIGRTLEFFPDSVFFTVLMKICKGAGLSLLITGLVNCIIRTWVRFVLNLYKDESYLTHTIPTTTTLHYISKVICTLIVIITSIIVLFVGIVIMYCNKENIEILKQSLNVLSTTLDVPVGSFIATVLLTIFLEIVFIVLVGDTGIIYGHSFNNGKLGKSVLIGIMIYFACNLITIGLVMIASIFSSDVYGILFEGQEAVSLDVLKILLICNNLLFIVYEVILFVVSYKKLQKGVNID